MKISNFEQQNPLLKLYKRKGLHGRILPIEKIENISVEIQSLYGFNYTNDESVFDKKSLCGNIILSYLFYDGIDSYFSIHSQTSKIFRIENNICEKMVADKKYIQDDSANLTEDFNNLLSEYYYNLLRDSINNTPIISLQYIKKTGELLSIELFHDYIPMVLITDEYRTRINDLLKESFNNLGVLEYTNVSEVETEKGNECINGKENLLILFNRKNSKDISYKVLDYRGGYELIFSTNIILKDLRKYRLCSDKISFRLKNNFKDLDLRNILNLFDGNLNKKINNIKDLMTLG